jgi:hypothetical protein
MNEAARDRLSVTLSERQALPKAAQSLLRKEYLSAERRRPTANGVAERRACLLLLRALILCKRRRHMVT